MANKTKTISNVSSISGTSIEGSPTSGPKYLPDFAPKWAHTGGSWTKIAATAGHQALNIGALPKIGSHVTSRRCSTSRARRGCSSIMESATAGPTQGAEGDPLFRCQHWPRSRFRRPDTTTNSGQVRSNSAKVGRARPTLGRSLPKKGRWGTPRPISARFSRNR